MKTSLILGIESSCDDTSVAIVDSKGFVLGMTSASQDGFHSPYGGIVPEIASRNHTLHILPLIDQCLSQAKLSWKNISGLAVTNRPGLLGSLLVGVVTAKSLALAHNCPFLGIHHLEAHLLSPFLTDKNHQLKRSFSFPYLALTVSGGHTSLYFVEDLGVYKLLGRTLDDAAGEAFDKFAKMVNLGFPGGVAVDRCAQNGDPQAFLFPRSLENSDSLNFSFSGLKTAALRVLQSLPPTQIEQQRASLCASFQEAIVDSLLNKLRLAQQRTGIQQIAIVGGVSANSRLRQQAAVWAETENVECVIPPLRYCTDNGAMVAWVGSMRLARGESSIQNLGPLARASLV